MKKIIILTLFIFLFLFSIVSFTLVQANQEELPTRVFRCLESKRCDLKESQCSRESGHRVRLTTKADHLPERNKETYVVMCTDIEGEELGTGNVCTTGDSELDKEVLTYDGLNILKSSDKTGREFRFGTEIEDLFLSNGQKVDKRGIKANSQGKLSNMKNQVIEPLEWEDYTPKVIGRNWFALNLLYPTDIPMGQGGVQQGTFIFEGGDLSDCAYIYWDPYGIVFDSQSLEPIPNVRVTLLKKRETGQFTKVGAGEVISLLNPLYTDEGGYFAFYVPDGTYKLDVFKSGFNFPSDPAKLHPNYSKIYSDIYPAETGEEIIQKGKIQHRDIPLDAQGEPYRSSVKLLSSFPLLGNNGVYIIKGRVSHPLTKIELYGKECIESDPPVSKSCSRTRLLITTKADKRGHFEVQYNLNKLNPGEFVGEIVLIKTDLTTITAADVLGVTTSSTTLSINNPIFNYIEGYAYDKRGQPIPNATVAVYFPYGERPLYETKADEKGYFKITSEYLPPFTYQLRYTTPTGISFRVTTSDFIAQNNQFIKEEKINLYSFKNQAGRVLTPKPQRTRPLEEREGLISPTKAGFPLSQASQSTNLIIIVVILLLLITIVAVLLSLYYLKKKTASSDTLNQ